MMRARMTLLSEMDAIVKVLDSISLISRGEAEMMKDEEGGERQDLRSQCLKT